MSAWVNQYVYLIVLVYRFLTVLLYKVGILYSVTRPYLISEDINKIKIHKYDKV